jgi:site-specific recombinase XerD
VTAHVMRHTFAALLLSGGVSLYKVARWLGDGAKVVEDHYGHLVAEDQEIERLVTGASVDGQPSSVTRSSARSSASRS